MSSAAKGGMRICVCTSVEAAQEPRGPRHANWLAGMNPGHQVIFVDCAPLGAPRRSIKALEGVPNLEWRTHHFPVRSGHLVRLIWARLRQRFAQWRFKTGAAPEPGALSPRALGMEKILDEIGADLYLAHNSETLLPAWRAARRRGALLAFDSMEFHSDMGDSQTPVERELVRAIERQCLPDCALVLTASDQIATALVEEYGLKHLVALYNVPHIQQELPAKPARGLVLYWRNAVIGLGQRGLDEALVALTKLPEDVTLHLQGRLPFDGGAALQARITELGLASRVQILPPHAPEDAVKEAGRQHVGLCLERKGCRNHDLTVSNKIFDYHMAGLAVIASDLPGLRGTLERSNGGLLFPPGDPDALVERIDRLHRDVTLRETLSENARAFALREGNRDWEREKFVAAFTKVCPSLISGTRNHAS